MAIVKRWFMKTREGEIIDGPYRVETQKEEVEFRRAVALYTKTYRYVPVLVEEEMDSDEFISPGERDSIGMPTGKHTRGWRWKTCRD